MPRRASSSRQTRRSVGRQQLLHIFGDDDLLPSSDIHAQRFRPHTDDDIAVHIEQREVSRHPVPGETPDHFTKMLVQEAPEFVAGGYSRHPRMDRFRAQPFPLMSISRCLDAVQEEARARGYNFIPD